MARIPFAVSALILSCVLATAALGQGKIAGRVLDQSTGESLIGVNIVLEETSQGTVTDADGNYVIVNVRPGSYTIVFSYVGYQTQRVEGVQVTTGQTTRYDIRLSEQVIEWRRDHRSG